MRVAVDSLLWGEAYAASAESTTVTGVVDRWADKNDKVVLMIKWEGYGRCQAAPLAALDKAANGESLNFKLLPDDKGNYPTRDINPPAPDPPAPDAPAPPAQATPTATATGEAMQGGGDVETPETFMSGSMKWCRRHAEYVRVDARKQARQKCSLNTGGLSLNKIEALFAFFLPPEWWELVDKYTNPLLDGTKEVTKKLTYGEYLRFIGYMISLSGIPLHKMWSLTAPPDSTAAAPAMGRFGISQNRFDKLRSVWRVGPTDDESYEQNEWCIVEGLVDSFNSHMFKQVNAGWLLGVDESISAWRGKVGKRDPRKCPHRMFVKRKPEPFASAR